MLRWYHGDTRGARRDLESVVESTNRAISEFPANTDLILLKRAVQERWADITLFGEAMSGQNAERLGNGIFRYSEAIKSATNDHKSIIRWKQAILYSLQGDLEQAETLLKENPPLVLAITNAGVINEDEDEPHEGVYMYLMRYPTLLRQLAEAVLFYYQSEDGADRNQKLRIFQRQFSSQNNATPETAAPPEILELLVLCIEFLVSDALNHEEWETLGDSISATSQGIAEFLRQYPGATPFMRRLHELLIRAAVLTRENAGRARDKQTQIRNIVRILKQMRPGGESDAIGAEMPTLIYFFLPENNKQEEGFVIFYPQDDREGTLYPLPLTRQKVKQREPTTMLPPLPEQLLQQIAEEKSANRKIRISWNDEASWSSAENAMTDKDYPYEKVLPLR
jgi:hypothetical protein